MRLNREKKVGGVISPPRVGSSSAVGPADITVHLHRRSIKLEVSNRVIQFLCAAGGDRFRGRLSRYNDGASREIAGFSDGVLLRTSVLNDQCPLRGIPRCTPASRRYRTSDGTCNNFDQLWMGAAMTPMQRFLPPMYEDGVQSPKLSVLGGSLPSARDVSITIHRDEDREMSAVTLMFMQWGQFLDHDVTSTVQSRSFNASVPRCCLPGGTGFLPDEFTHPECLPIPVPRDDWFLSHFGVRCLEFIRSAPSTRIDCDLGWREQINQVTSYIDASAVYGSDAQRAESLRIFRGGQLQYGRRRSQGRLHPPDPPQGEICRTGAVSTACFLGGDLRVGEQPALTAMHTVWLRYHNKLANALQTLNRHWSDEKLYQEARRIVAALIQHITYREFLPVLLGQDVIKLFELTLQRKGYYRDYDPRINPSPANSFSTAAFRFGHSLVQNSFVRADVNHRSLFNNVPIHEEQENLENIWSPGALDRLILGLCNQASQRRDEFISDELTNHLFQTPGAPFGMDLVAINIQRGRDHGVPSYTAWREPCGLSTIQTWRDLERVMAPETAERFRSVYADVDDIDLYSGGLAERPVRGGVVGPTFACIIAQQFLNMRKGDRFWYENGGFESSFTPAQLQQIRKVSFAQVICHSIREIDTIQPFVFLSADDFVNPRVGCHDPSIGRFDLTSWDEVQFDPIDDAGNFNELRTETVLIDDVDGFSLIEGEDHLVLIDDKLENFGGDDFRHKFDDDEVGPESLRQISDRRTEISESIDKRRQSNQDKQTITQAASGFEFHNYSTPPQDVSPILMHNLTHSNKETNFHLTSSDPVIDVDLSEIPHKDQVSPDITDTVDSDAKLTGRRSKNVKDEHSSEPQIDATNFTETDLKTHADLNPDLKPSKRKTKSTRKNDAQFVINLTNEVESYKKTDSSLNDFGQRDVDNYSTLFSRKQETNDNSLRRTTPHFNRLEAIGFVDLLRNYYFNRRLNQRDRLTATGDLTRPLTDVTITVSTKEPNHGYSGIDNETKTFNFFDNFTDRLTDDTESTVNDEREARDVDEERSDSDFNKFYKLINNFDTEPNLGYLTETRDVKRTSSTQTMTPNLHESNTNLRNDENTNARLSGDETKTNTDPNNNTDQTTTFIRNIDAIDSRTVPDQITKIRSAQSNSSLNSHLPQHDRGQRLLDDDYYTFLRDNYKTDDVLLPTLRKNKRTELDTELTHHAEELLTKFEDVLFRKSHMNKGDCNLNNNADVTKRTFNTKAKTSTATAYVRMRRNSLAATRRHRRSEQVKSFLLDSLLVDYDDDVDDDEQDETPKSINKTKRPPTSLYYSKQYSDPIIVRRNTSELTMTYRPIVTFTNMTVRQHGSKSSPQRANSTYDDVLSDLYYYHVPQGQDESTNRPDDDGDMFILHNFLDRNDQLEEIVSDRDHSKATFTTDQSDSDRNDNDNANYNVNINIQYVLQSTSRPSVVKTPPIYIANAPAQTEITWRPKPKRPIPMYLRPFTSSLQGPVNYSPYNGPHGTKPPKRTSTSYPIYVVQTVNKTRPTTYKPVGFYEVPVYVSRPSNGLDYVTTKRPYVFTTSNQPSVIDEDYDPVYEDDYVTTKRPSRKPFPTQRPSVFGQQNPYQTSYTATTTRPIFPSYLYLPERPISFSGDPPKDPIDNIYSQVLSSNAHRQPPSGEYLTSKPSFGSNSKRPLVHKIDDKLAFKAQLLPARLQETGYENFVKISSSLGNHLHNLNDEEPFASSGSLQAEKREDDVDLDDPNFLPGEDGLDVVQIEVIPSDEGSNTWVSYNATEEVMNLAPVPEVNFGVQCASELPKPMNVSGRNLFKRRG